MHYIFCVSGYSKVGKDEFCKGLVERHGAIHTGMTDPAKRHMAAVYGWDRQRLFGPSELRNAGDPKYPKPVVESIGAVPIIHHDRHWQADIHPGMAHLLTGAVITWGRSPCVIMGDDEVDCTFVQRSHIRIFFADTDPRFFLSAREALQIHCSGMDHLYRDTWVRSGIELHRKLVLSSNVNGPFRYSYDRMLGLVEDHSPGPANPIANPITCFSDFRHWHEIRYAREAGRTQGFTPVIIRVKRPGIDKPPFNHITETEQATIPDSEFDYIVHNNDTLEGLYSTVDTIVEQVKRNNG